MSFLGRWLMVVLLASLVPATAQTLAAGPDRAAVDRAAARFPQPVRVGALIDRQVLRPVERQDVLGRVAAVVTRPDGGIDVLLRLGGVHGFGTRDVAVPIEAMVLLGEYMEVVDLSPAQLQALPTVDARTTPALPPDTIIRVGLARPSH